MKTSIFFCIATITAVTAVELEVDGKAASRQVSCECQCSNTEFRDKYGQLNGNCKSADKTGALWCYVDPKFNRCKDLQPSQRFGQLWSYEACATPEIGAPLCPFGGNYPNNGGFNNGGFNNGGFNNNGGYPVGSNNGGFSNGGFNNGGFNNGGLNNNGGYPSGSNSGGYPSGSISGGYPGSSNGGYPGIGGYPGNGGQGIRVETGAKAAVESTEKKTDSVNFG